LLPDACKDRNDYLDASDLRAEKVQKVLPNRIKGMGILPPLLSRAATRGLILAMCSGVLVGAIPSSVRAEVRVTGSAEVVKLEASDTTAERALAALGAHFKLRYRASVALDRAVSGTYEGPLPHVISRLLDGYNYIVGVKSSPDSVEVVVLGKSGKNATPGAPADNVIRLPPFPPAPVALAAAPGASADGVIRLPPFPSGQ
jgi:hypothetical protein